MADQDHDPLRLSITLPGSASLGAFQAGAMAALAEAIIELREQGTAVHVDALGGASAGSIVALLFSRGALGDGVQLPERWKGLTMVDERFIDACHRAGIAVHVWAINDADDMDGLFELGVDAVMTDRPQVLRDVLRRRSTW